MGMIALAVILGLMLAGTVSGVPWTAAAFGLSLLILIVDVGQGLAKWGNE